MVGVAVGRVKPALFLLGMTPFARWIWLGLNNGLTANPVEFLTRSSGTWTLVCLLVTLAITPLRRLTGQRRWCAAHVRAVCLFGFQHFMAWVWWDRGFDPGQMLADIGAALHHSGLCRLCADGGAGGHVHAVGHAQAGQTLAAPAPAVYAIGLLAVLHYWWHKAGKNDLEQPMIYAAVLAVLLAGGWPPGGGVVPERGRLPAAARVCRGG